MADDTAIYNHLKAKNPGATDAQLLQGVAELKAKGFEPPTKGMLDYATDAVNFVDRGVKKVAGVVTPYVKDALVGRFDQPVKGVISEDQAQEFGDAAQRGAEAIVPQNVTDAAVMAVPGGRFGTGVVKGIAGRGLATGAVGATTGFLSDSGDPVDGAIQGLTAGALAGTFKKLLKPGDAQIVGQALEAQAPWMRVFRRGAQWTENDLANLTSPEARAQHVGRQWRGMQQMINDHQVAGQRVGDMRFDFPGLSQTLPLTPQQRLVQAQGGAATAQRELLSFDQALTRLQQMEAGPQRDAAEMAMVGVLNNISNAGLRVMPNGMGWGDLYMDTVTNTRRVHDAGRFLARMIQPADRMQNTGAGSFSVPGPGGGRWFEPLKAIFQRKEPMVTVDKATRTLRGRQTDQGLRFDPHYWPQLGRVTGVTEAQPDFAPNAAPTLLGQALRYRSDDE